MRTLLGAMILILTATVFGGTASASDPFLYAGDNYTGTLHKIDKTTGATVTTIPITLGGAQVDSIKGLAADPFSGELYAVVRDGGPEGTIEFKLATIAPDTGVATEIGTLNDRFAGLAFVTLPPTEGAPSSDALMGVTGDGATNPEELYVIDTGDASTSFYMNLGNGTDGEAIAFNPNDSLLYHLSGWGFGQPPEGIQIVFEKIDLGTMSITNIPLSGDVFTNGNGLTFDETTGQFFFSAGVDPPKGGEGFSETELFSVTTVGVATSLGATDTYFGGMGFSYLVPVELQSFSIE